MNASKLNPRLSGRRPPVSQAATSNPDVADPFTDPTKAGTVFEDHSCYRCDSGNKPCIKGKGRERDCDTLFARND